MKRAFKINNWTERDSDYSKQLAPLTSYVIMKYMMVQNRPLYFHM